ncbi:MAG: HAD family hydrolase [Collinsella sp.]
MQAVIFDMDGTLIDTERVSQAAWRRAAQDFRIEIPERILHAFVGCSIPNAMNMIDDEFGDPAFTERLFNRRHEIFDATWEDELETQARAAEAVAAVRERGLAAALATSSVRDRTHHEHGALSVSWSCSTPPSSTRTSSITNPPRSFTSSPPTTWTSSPRGASP